MSDGRLFGFGQKKETRRIRERNVFFFLKIVVSKVRRRVTQSVILFRSGRGKAMAIRI